MRVRIYFVEWLNRLEMNQSLVKVLSSFSEMFAAEAGVYDFPESCLVKFCRNNC